MSVVCSVWTFLSCGLKNKSPWTVSGRILIGIKIHWNMVYWVYGRKQFGKTQQDKEDWVYRVKMLERTQQNVKDWVYRRKLLEKAQQNEKHWVHK